MTQSRYRCVECGHGRNLTAWFEANIEGPVAEDGTAAAHVYVEDTLIYESSIACTTHGDIVTIQKFDGEAWCEHQHCDHCEGRGYREIGWNRRRTRCDYCDSRGQWWEPVAVPEVPSPPKAHCA